MRTHCSVDSIDDVPFIVARALLVLVVIFSYPLQTYPCRQCILNIIESLQTSSVAPTISTGARVGAEAATMRRRSSIQKITSALNWKFIATTLFVLAGTYAIGMTVSSLGLVLAFIGATASTTVCFILPFLFYYKMRKDGRFDVLVNGKYFPVSLWRSWITIVTAGMLALGIGLMVVCTVGVFI